MDTESIYYRSPVGALALTTTGDNLSALFFVNSWKGPATEEDTLTYAAPQSAIMQKCFAQLNDYFNGSLTAFDLPLAQNGTPFQQTVWAELCNIPYGRTISYLELSKRIGNVKAIRAVGTANGSNNISIIVPCHRVIGSNGDLIGYGGELWRKKWLLAHEAKIGNGVQTLF